jgi:hypothetical protein
MKKLIQSLPEAKQKEFYNYEIYNLIENFQTAFSAMAICFAHAIIAEPDMMQSQQDNARAALIWMDEQLNDLRELENKNQNLNFLQT